MISIIVEEDRREAEQMHPVDRSDPQVYHPGLHWLYLLWRGERRYERGCHDLVSRA